MATERTRKHQSKRKNGGNLNGLYLVISVVLILAVILGGSIVFFKINAIEVEGNVHYTEEEIVDASGVNLGDNLLLTRDTTVVARLLTQLPYVSSVTLSHKLPDTLVITVAESDAQAAIYDGSGSWWLMDSNGKLLELLGSGTDSTSDEEAASGDLEPEPEAEEADTSEAEPSSSGVEPEAETVEMPDPPEGYPYITGLTLYLPEAGSVIAVEENGERSQSLMLESLLNLLPAFQNRGLLEDVVSIDLSGESEIIVNYQNRLTIKLLQDEDYDYKAKLILGVLEDYVDATWEDGDTGTLDMTFSNGNPRLTKD
ncbi:MAG: FtsQ-type POTRA domain-containing protein [Clostridiales bacterium]|nr:FtsQ-type POTRA domain-containing protein [Clostridiales bacterium]MCC8098738.1 FtsQ-type POTRA domain-containing protein [Clostridiales bacterium]